MITGKITAVRKNLSLRMSKIKFNQSQRQAIWEAYNKKCAYSGELIYIDSFHIDHIIPESIAGDPYNFEQLRTKFGLDDSFNISGFENLLPCSPARNLQKGSSVLSESSTRFFLEMAAKKKPIVLSILNRIKNRINNGLARIMLIQALETGKITQDEVVKILDDYGNRPEKIFHLIKPLDCFEIGEINTIVVADIDKLRNLPIKIKSDEYIDGVTLTNDSMEKIHVKNCKEFDAAIDDGFFPQTTYEMKIASFFSQRCGLLKALEGAAEPEISFIEKPRVGITDLHLLPIVLFPFMMDSEQREDTGSYQDKAHDGSLIVKSIRSNSLRIEEPEGMGQLLIEVARADFNGDGFEDILMYEYIYATHGTLGAGVATLLGRHSASGPFERISTK